MHVPNYSSHELSASQSHCARCLDASVANMLKLSPQSQVLRELL